MSELAYTDARNKQEQETWLYLCPRGLTEGHVSIFGLAQPDHNFVPASLDDLRREMTEQKRLLELGFHPDGKLCPWTGMVHVNERTWFWAEAMLDYLPLRGAEDTVEVGIDDLLGIPEPVARRLLEGQPTCEIHPAVLRYLLTNASAGPVEDEDEDDDDAW